MLKELRVEIQEQKENLYRIGYQGGVFEFIFSENNEIIDLFFRYFNAFTHEQSMQVLMVANEVNLHGRWTCYLTREEAGQEEKPVAVHLSLSFFPQDAVAQVAAALRALHPDAFAIKREFDNQIREVFHQKREVVEDSVNNDFQNKIELIRLRKKAGYDLNKPQEEELPPSKYMTIKAWTELYADVDWGCPVEMKVLTDDKLEIETNAGRIMAFNAREYIRKCATSAIPQELMITVAFENQNLLVNLRKEKGGNEKALFYRACIVYNGTWNRNHLSAPQTHLSLVEIRLTTEKEDTWEAKYLIDEALDKWNNGKRAEMTDEQREIVDCMMPNIELDLYWGKKLYNQECFLQALAYFKRIHRSLGYQWVYQREENRHFYSRICYYIGFIYMELGIYDTAYYYLHRAQNYETVPAIQEFTNCLCNMQDVDAILYIQPMRERVLQALKESEEPDDFRLEFYRFLSRRMVYTLINNRQLEEATTMLQQMITNGESVEFAQKELAYIEELKKKEKEQ